MADKIEMANDVVVESGYKQTDTTQLITTASADTAAPTLASQGVALSNSYGGIIQVSLGASDTCDFLVWGYHENSGEWTRIRELDKTALDTGGDTWKAAIGGMTRLYVQLANGTYTTGDVNVWFHRSYS